MKELTQKDEMKELLKQHLHSVNRAELKGQRQCTEHKWRKMSDNEIACKICPTVRIIDPKTMKNYV